MSNQINNIVKCKVTGISKFGAFVKIEGGGVGMIHISEVSRDFVKDISTVLKVGDVVSARILSISDDGKVSLSLKDVDSGAAEKKAVKETKKKEPKTPPVSSPGDYVWEKDEGGEKSFEEMMSSFKRTSEEKMSELKRGENRAYSRRKGSKR